MLELGTDLQVIDRPALAAALVQPLRQSILEALDPPDSAAGVARRLELPRQKINYHLRELERLGLVQEVEERRKGNCVERVMRPIARRFVISPAALGSVGAETASLRDRFSWSYLVGVAARAVRELGHLRRRAEATGKRVPTLCMESEIRIASASRLELFTRELTAAITEVIERHHDQRSPRGRRFRLFLGAHPAVAAANPGSESGGNDE